MLKVRYIEAISIIRFRIGLGHPLLDHVFRRCGYMDELFYIWVYYFGEIGGQNGVGFYVNGRMWEKVEEIRGITEGISY